MAVTVTVLPATTKLIALADLKAILGITDGANDTLLGNIIQRGSDAIARFCNRVFAQRTVIETLPGPGGGAAQAEALPNHRPYFDCAQRRNGRPGHLYAHRTGCRDRVLRVVLGLHRP